jgi:hypothetical protein
MAGTVTIGCRLPCGYVMEVWGMEEVAEPLLGGGSRIVKRAVSLNRRVKINGSARQVGKDSPHEIRNAAGLTHGVDADLWAAWLAQHQDDDLVKNNIIFASTKGIDVEAKAKEVIAEKTGFEPIDPGKMPPEFKRIEAAKL